MKTFQRIIVYLSIVVLYLSITMPFIKSMTDAWWVYGINGILCGMFAGIVDDLIFKRYRQF
jgi:hypothetical protein